MKMKERQENVAVKSLPLLKRIVFSGDSITRGKVGVDWVNHLSRVHEEWSVTNISRNGDALMAIAARTEQYIAANPTFDYLVIQAGTNDLILDHLLNSRNTIKTLKKFSPVIQQPVINDTERFALTYKKMVTSIHDHFKGKIILCTIGCIGENLSSCINKKRAGFNEAIRRTARETGASLADTAAVMDGYLQLKKPNNYLLHNLLRVKFFDRWCCKFPNGADHLSRNRQLNITIDGVHLNSKGAAIFRKEVESQLIYLETTGG